MAILPHIYFSSLQSKREQIFLWEKVSKQIRPIYWRELGTRVNAMIRGLDSIGVGFQERVGILTKNGINSFFAHVSVQNFGAISLCFSKNCTTDIIISSLRESAVKVVFVDTLMDAEKILAEKDRVPQLSHIVIMEAIGTTRGETPSLITFLDLIEMGKTQPDRSIIALKKIQPTDRALYIYSPGDIGAHVLMQTHEDLENRFNRLSHYLPPHTITKDDVMLVASQFHESPMHFITSMLPLWYGCQALYAEDTGLDDLMLPQLNPSVIVGASSFLEHLKLELMEKSNIHGKPEQSILYKAAKIGRARYERPNKLTISEKLKNRFLKKSYMRKFQEFMGNKLISVLTTDTDATYDTQIFYFSFGVELHEVDAES